MAYSNKKILEIVTQTGYEKANRKWYITIIAGFITAFLAGLGYLAWFKFVQDIPYDHQILDAILYPIGATLATWGGGEMVLTSALYVTTAFLAKRVGFFDMMKDFLLVYISNFIGMISSAYLFGHVAGLMEGDLILKTIEISKEKINTPNIATFIAGMGCNLIYLIAVWYTNSTEKPLTKLVYIWIGVMVYFVLDFQHTLTNTFTISTAIFSGISGITIFEFLENVLLVLLGNLFGGILFTTIPNFIINKEKEKA